VQAQQSDLWTFDGHAVEDIDQLQDLFENDDAATQHGLGMAYAVETAIDPLIFAGQKNLIEDTDDLVSRPYNYQGRQLMVAGSVVRFFWEYRLKSKSGQKTIVIDVDGLNQSDRAKLDAAIDRAGIFGRVRARIHGRVARQTSAALNLVATELVLIEPADPTEMLVPTRSSLRRRESDDLDLASLNDGTAGGGGLGSSDSGAGDTGGGDTGGGDTGGGDTGAGDTGGGDTGGGDTGGGDTGGGDTGGGDTGGGDTGGGDTGGGDTGGGNGRGKGKGNN
jgi:hypothetical protein